MIQGIDTNKVQQFNDPKSVSTSSTQQGQYQGVSVSLAPNTASLVQDALEELTNSLSEKAEKDLSKRKIKDAMGDTQMQLDKIQELMKAAFKIEQRAQIDEMVNDLLSGKQGGGNALRDRLREFSDDSSEQYLALIEIRRQLMQTEGNEALLQMVNQQIAQLESTDGSRIAAGLNSFISATEFAEQGLGNASDLRGFYQDSVLDYQGLSGAWNKLVEQYGESRLELAAGFMLKALAADYESAGSSIDKNQLVSIMADMNTIKMLAAVHDSCLETAKILKNPEQPESSPSGRDIMKHLLHLYDLAWAQEDDVNEFLENLNITDLQQKIEVLTSIKAAIGLIPKDDNNNPERMSQAQQCITAISDVLENLIEVEEYGE